MNLRKGQTSLRTSHPIALMGSVSIITTPISSYTLVPMTHRELLLKRKNHPQLTGMPEIYALSLTGDIEVWPTPDRDYEVRVRFYGPMLEE